MQPVYTRENGVFLQSQNILFLPRQSKHRMREKIQIEAGPQKGNTFREKNHIPWIIISLGCWGCRSKNTRSVKSGRKQGVSLVLSWQYKWGLMEPWKSRTFRMSLKLSKSYLAVITSWLFCYIGLKSGKNNKLLQSESD